MNNRLSLFYLLISFILLFSTSCNGAKGESGGDGPTVAGASSTDSSESVHATESDGSTGLTGGESEITSSRATNPSAGLSSAQAALTTGSVPSIDIPANGIDEEKRILYVDKAFGSVPDDGRDDAPAIRKAIAKASDGRGWVLYLSPGVYTISPESLQDAISSNRDYQLRQWVQYCFYYSGLNNITFLGHDTTFMLTDALTGLFCLTDCQGITVRDITVDMLKLPWVQGTVSSVDAASGTFVMKADEGYDILDDQRCRDLYDVLGSNKHITGNNYGKNAPGILKATGNDHFVPLDYQKTGSNTYRFTVDSFFISKENIDVGDRLVINCRTGGSTTFELVNGTHDVILKNVNIYASAGFAVLSTYGKGRIDIDNLQILRKPGTGRMITILADGFHAQGMKGPAVVTNCTFEGMMDDGINFYQSPTSLVAVVSSTQMVIHHPRYIVSAGETLTFYNSATGTFKGSAKVTQTKPHTKGVMVTLDKPLSGLSGGSSGDSVFTSALSFGGSVIKNNTFRQYRGGGIMCRGENITIEGNTFKEIAGVGVNVQNYTNSEGPGGSHITIRNNTFDSNAYMSAYTYNMDVNIATINVRAVDNSWGEVDAKLNRNIVIEGNRLLNQNIIYGINVSSADNVVVKNNTISGKNMSQLPAYIISPPAPRAFPVRIKNSSNVQVTGNTITDSRPWVVAGMLIHNASCSNVTQSDNKVTVNSGKAVATSE